MTEPGLNNSAFEAIVEYNPNALIVVDNVGDIAYSNRKGETLFGYSKEELKGQPVKLLFPKHFDNQLQFKKMFFEGADTGRELTALKKGGTDFTVEISITEIDTHDGAVILLCIGDITDRVTREATIKKQMTELKVAGNYLEQLAYISAHDIKNPIITLDDLGNELLRSKDLKADDVQLLKMQQKVIAQMRKTNKGINDILKLRQGLLVKENADSGQMALGTILGNITDTLRADIENTNTSLRVNLNGLSEIQFPYLYLQSAFYNLLTNAIKYRKPGRDPVVTFDASRVDGQTYRFVVTDNGLGFDMASTKENLFGIFKRFHPKIEGTGLGLHIVKSIVDAYGGEIVVNSEVDKGTTFDITLKNPILAQ